MQCEFLEPAYEETHIHRIYKHESNLQYVSSLNGNEEWMGSHEDEKEWVSV
jgi:hypothetical protein